MHALAHPLTTKASKGPTMTQPRSDPSLKKAAQLQWSDNNGSFGVTSITDRPFVLVILGQTFVSMRQMAV
jgi:hypothetical protein